MRADRLVAALLLLQQRGRVTAVELASELEVSERTARRDLEALGAAGLPVYAQQGRGGGWRLAGRGRTDLSGLSLPEVRALFLATPATADPSGSSLRNQALRKLAGALPKPLRESATAAATAVVVDSAGWDRAPGPASLPEHLDVVQRAVIDAEQLRLSYRTREGHASTRVVHPLGLVAKGANWYLLTDTDAGSRTFRLDRVSGAEPTGEPVERPAGFDLNEAWRRVVAEMDQRRTPVHASALADPRCAEALRWTLGTRATAGEPVPDGRVRFALRGHSVRSLAAELAGFGASLEVLEPDELRQQLADVAAELIERYGARR